MAMTREAQIRQTACDWLHYYHLTCTQDMLVEAFRCGAEWADAHQPLPWISVSDKLPDRAWSNKMGCLTEDSDIVFAMTSSGKLFCNLYYSYELKNWLEKSAGLNGMDRALRYDKVTHWMPIIPIK